MNTKLDKIIEKIKDSLAAARKYNGEFNTIYKGAEKRKRPERPKKTTITLSKNRVSMN